MKRLKCDGDCRWCGKKLTYVNQCKCPGNPEPHGRCPRCGAIFWMADDGRRAKK
jgi:hypothetical protein